MNKILTIMSLFLFGCSGNDTVTISRTEYNQLIGDTIKPEYPKKLIVGNNEYNIVLGSDGHEYYGSYFGIGGYSSEAKHFHWIECKKCKSDTL